ncbi:hypothetical protein DPMN_026585 [Dreissena polymorpha]|uniref:Uncharacterized protein n=1 Tax=Dreissena polymorpha TaxID=45954 RepID=A0A9D4REG5_DREPO|nr:hypothetical protein DPMN_026585 [Dreissena polymorpha]
MIKAHILISDDCMSKVETKHASETSDPVQFLMNFGETDTLSEQDEALADKYLVRVWAGPDQRQLQKHLIISDYRTIPVLVLDLIAYLLQAV